MNKQKIIGVIVEVDGDVAKVGMYNNTNDSDFIWNGDLLTGPKVGAFLTINQNDIKIITTVYSEKVTDEQNSFNSMVFDNTYQKETIRKLVSLKVKGVIEEGSFTVTSRYVPMIGNKVSLTTRQELNQIYGILSKEPFITIGKSILEDYPVNIPINGFFSSHIGIFGNTGSGKSNTLHKLYLELFKSCFKEKIREKSKFFLIDFNGEYTNINQFGLDNEDINVININTKFPKKGNKLKVKKEYLFDPDILSILFDARPATQVPFLRTAIKRFNEIKNAEQFSKLEVGLLEKLITGHRSVASDSIDNWCQAANLIGVNEELLENIKLHFYLQYGQLEIRNNGTLIVEGEQITEEGRETLRLDKIKNELENIYEKTNDINKLRYFLEFQKVYVSAWKSTNLQHINPLFKRIESSIVSLEKVIEINEKPNENYKMMNVITLVNANQEITRLVPMLFSKMIYDDQKDEVSKNESIIRTKHLIIDEAHNILNSQHQDVGDDWRDYRLSVFEEMIKEGRKFGFYLTICSQRPYDISSTIISQIHNYLIHRIVNEKDLIALNNTMPTLDRFSYSKIPSLGQGECIITGSAINVPVLVKVDKEEIVRPKSDDITLTDFWK
ncbi:MAG: ATP-binding protein [Erysipelotrichaceae bacterium]|nr:ATP-binding protein [Erysipelotrichaceae bacterium]